MGHNKNSLALLFAFSLSLSQAVELEKFSPRNVTRYMVVITTQGVQDTEETIVLGTEQVSDM